MKPYELTRHPNETATIRVSPEIHARIIAFVNEHVGEIGLDYAVLRLAGIEPVIIDELMLNHTKGMRIEPEEPPCMPATSEKASASSTKEWPELTASASLAACAAP